MKKLLCFILAAVMVFAIAGCGGAKKETARNTITKEIDTFEEYATEYAEYVKIYKGKDALTQIAGSFDYVEKSVEYSKKAAEFLALELKLNSAEIEYYNAAKERINSRLAEAGELLLDGTKAEDTDQTETTESPEITNSPEATEFSDSTPEATVAPTTSPTVSDSFKKSADEFEAFVDEVVAFVDEYNKKDGFSQFSDSFKYAEYTMQLGLEYTSFELSGMFLSGPDKEYYMEVYRRVNDKLRPYNLNFDSESDEK